MEAIEQPRSYEASRRSHSGRKMPIGRVSPSPCRALLRTWCEHRRRQQLWVWRAACDCRHWRWRHFPMGSDGTCTVPDFSAVGSSSLPAWSLGLGPDLTRQSVRAAMCRSNVRAVSSAIITLRFLSPDGAVVKRHGEDALDHYSLPPSPPVTGRQRSAVSCCHPGMEMFAAEHHSTIQYPRLHRSDIRFECPTPGDITPLLRRFSRPLMKATRW